MSLPFRIGTTSFIYPGGWLANVQRLASRFADIEILLFESDGPDTLPGKEECAGLAALKARAGVSYSLHPPLDVHLASEDEGRRRSSLASVQRAIGAARPLRPEATIVRVYLGDGEHSAQVPTDLAGGRRRACKSLEAILSIGVAPADLCVEVLDNDYRLIEPVIADLGLSVALDVGHLLREGRDETELLERHLHRTRVIQWHGVDPESRDHRSLAHYPPERARRLIDMLIGEAYRGVVTIEVFREADLEDSLSVLTALLRERVA
jgi:sugar phosphate isomerase/epimerase